MGKMIAYCGLVCTDCGAYIATQKNDSKMRQEVAAKWTKEFGMNFTADDIICDGCLTVTGRVASYCPVCPIRKCGKEKGVINCAYCVDYSCEKTDEFFKMAPACKKTLDAIKKGIR